MKDAICKYVNGSPSVDKKKGREKADRLDVINECKITREKWSRRLVNKREVKSYQVVYDKRIILDEGDDTIPFGYHWEPSTFSTVKLVSPLTQTVPNHILFTLVQPPSSVSRVEQQMNYDSGDVSDEDTNSRNANNYCVEVDIDLIATDDESDVDYESENDYDRSFINDNEMSDDENESSFYRRVDNDSY
jgi:hypothetical protein